MRRPRSSALVAACVLLAGLAWSAPAAASIQATRIAAHVGAAHQQAPVHPLTAPHVNDEVGTRDAVVLRLVRWGARDVASTCRAGTRHPAGADDDAHAGRRDTTAVPWSISEHPSHWGAVHLSI